jgi:hypothetical protein
MRVTIGVASLFAGLLLGTQGVQAQRYVASGQTIQLYFVASVNPDCSAAGEPTVRITSPPQHGRAALDKTHDFVFFQQSNVRSECNRRRVSGVAVRYTSQRGYVGSDSVGVEIFFPKGNHRTGTFNVNVR